jgi:hypothetical protein
MKEGKHGHTTQDETRGLMHGACDEGATQEDCRLKGRKRLFIEISFRIKEYTTDKGSNPQIIARTRKPEDCSRYAGKHQNGKSATGNNIPICDLSEG